MGYRKIKEVQGTGKMLGWFGMIIAALAVILVGMLVLDLSVIPVCAIVLIEAGLIRCLNREPVWLHLLIIAAQIAVGVLWGSPILMAMAAALYLLGVLVL